MKPNLNEQQDAYGERSSVVTYNTVTTEVSRNSSLITPAPESVVGIRSEIAISNYHTNTIASRNMAVPISRVEAVKLNNEVEGELANNLRDKYLQNESYVRKGLYLSYFLSGVLSVGVLALIITLSLNQKSVSGITNELTLSPTITPTESIFTPTVLPTDINNDEFFPFESVTFSEISEICDATVIEPMKFEQSFATRRFFGVCISPAVFVDCRTTTNAPFSVQFSCSTNSFDIDGSCACNPAEFIDLRGEVDSIPNMCSEDLINDPKPCIPLDDGVDVNLRQIREDFINN